jgi:PAS domain-containing protein
MKKEFPKENKNFTQPKYNISTNHRNIFENMDLGVSIFELILDNEEKIVNLHVNYVNHRSILNKLKPREEIIDKTINELFEIDKVDLYLNMAREVVSTGKSIRYETYFEQFNKHFLINAFSINESLFVTLDLDTTQEKETEEKLRNTLEHLEIEKRQLSAIVENIPVGVIIAEAPSGKFILANKQIAEIWRYPSSERGGVFHIQFRRG